MQSSRKFNLTQHIDRVHKEQSAAALDPINQQRQHPKQMQQEVMNPNHDQVIPQQQQQQHISLNPPTMVGASAAPAAHIRVAYEQQPPPVQIAFPQPPVAVAAAAAPSRRRKPAAVTRRASFGCRFCEYSTTKESALQAHLMACHPGIAAVGNPASAAAAPLVSLPTQPLFPPSAVSGIDHFLSATSNPSVVPPPPLCSSLLKDAPKLHQCASCSFTSAYERNLKAHVKEVHLKEKRVHKCHLCTRFKSSRRSNLVQHIRYVRRKYSAASWNLPTIVRETPAT